MTDKLELLDSGQAALNNASAGGILIKPTSFKIGDSDLYPTDRTLSDIVGNYVCSGTFHHVETLSAQVCRFVLTIDTRLLTKTTTIREVVVFFESNVAFGRAVFAEEFTLEPNEPVRLSVVLATSRADLSTINVSVGEYDSIPSTAFLYRLPSPATSEFNAISVLNGKRNPDSTNSPVIATRYGAGSFQWGFTDHMRVFSGVPVSATSTSFKINSTLTFASDEQVIVHVVAGSGIGQTRRFRFNAGAQEFRDPDSQAIPNLAGCTVAIWRMQTGASGGNGAQGIPGTDGIPYDWVLTPGVDGGLVWQPPKAASRIISTLYVAPSKLNVRALNFMGSGDESRYSTGELVPENANYVYPALGLATQHRSAFQLYGSEVAFAEPIPSNVSVDLRVFTKTPSTGTRLNVVTIEFVGDGATMEYDLGTDVEDASHVFAFVSSILQPTTTYSIDAVTRKLRFISPIDAGLPVDLRLITYTLETAYSTRIVSKTYVTSGDTFFLKLPITPQSIEQVFISQSGAHIHQSNYTLVEDAIVFTSSLLSDIEVEVYIFDNVQSQGSEQTGLSGIVIDGYVSDKNLVLLRHNAPPVELPIPAPRISVGAGLSVDSTSGRAHITIDEDAFPLQKTPNQWTASQTENKTSNMIITQRVEVTRTAIFMVSADFSAKLGPGYESLQGTESIEFVVGIRSSQSAEPEFGRSIRGSGAAGITFNNATRDGMAYANASMTQIYELDPLNHTSGYVELIAKMRVTNANTSQFDVVLNINFNAIEIPK